MYFVLTTRYQIVQKLFRMGLIKYWIKEYSYSFYKDVVITQESYPEMVRETGNGLIFSAPFTCNTKLFSKIQKDFISPIERVQIVSSWRKSEH